MAVGKAIALSNSKLMAKIERGVKDPSYTLTTQRSNELIQTFQALFADDFGARLKALAELERDLKVVPGTKREDLSGSEKMAL
jgi:hypothetical protein